MKRFNIALFLFIQTGLLLAAPLPGELHGLWQGLVRGVGSHYHDTVLVSITFLEGGNVIGYIGNAEIHSCYSYRNRGTVGRFLNLKTDYIVKDGTVLGFIFPEDEPLDQAFTFPFNILENGQIRGEFMLLQAWKYREPLLGPVYLTKTHPGNP